MGYTTDFYGSFNVEPPLKPEHQAYLEVFSTTRRMKRDIKRTRETKDPVRGAVGLPVGEQGGYFVGGGGFAGQDHDSTVVDYNSPPAGQPGLWCKWVPNDDGTEIVWNGMEKFYDYIEWLQYLVEHFLEPWGYTINGEVEWQGEESDDRGVIFAKNNMIATGEFTRPENPFLRR